jgi:hypothetical protein
VRARLIVVAAIVGSLMAAGMPAAEAGGGPEWVREPGGTLHAVTVGTGGSVYVTGTIWTPHRLVRALVVTKLGPDGGLYWRRTWRRLVRDWHGTGTALAPAPGGGVYVGGSEGRAECGDPILMRLSVSGRMLWRRELPNPECLGIVTELDADADGVVASVTSQGCCAIFDHDGYVQAMTPDGSLRWRTDLEAPGVPSGNWDSARGVALGGDGHVFVVGEVDRGTWSGEGPLPDEDIVIQRLSRTGRVEWTRVLPDPGVRDRDVALDVDVRGGVVVVGGQVQRRRWEEPRAWLGAFATDGRSLWSRRWGQGELSRGVTAVATAPWGPVYAGAYRYHATTEPSLQRWTIAGELLRERKLAPSALGGITDIATGRDVFLTVAKRVERWSR